MIVLTILVVIIMREHSEEEEGFIASDVEVRNKYTLRLAAISSQQEM